MMEKFRVISITEFDKRKRKVLLEGNLALVLYPGDIRKLGIEEGESLSQSVLDEIEELLFRRARERILGLLEFSDKTEFELRSRLIREGYPENAVGRALAAVQRHGYINDEAYGRRYAQAKASGKSRKQILTGLLQKGIDRELAENLLKDQPVDEEGQARRLLEQKGYQGRKLEKKERDKAAAMLARRGYSFDVIRRVLGDFSEEWL